MHIYWNSLDYSIKFITVFYLLAYKCMPHENFIAEAFYKLGSSESIGKEKSSVINYIWRSISKTIFNLKAQLNRYIK